MGRVSGGESDRICRQSIEIRSVVEAVRIVEPDVHVAEVVRHDEDHVGGSGGKREDEQKGWDFHEFWAKWV